MLNQENELNVARNYWENQQYEQAICIYKRYAQSGDALAQYMLAYGYECGYGIEQNAEESAKWYHKSALQEYQWAQNSLGNCYYNGFGVAKDYKIAAQWYLKSANQGSEIAQNSLGVLYEIGTGVEQDYSKASYWYEMSANNGHDVARDNLEELKVRMQEENSTYENVVIEDEEIRSCDEDSEYANITIEESFAKLNKLVGLTEVKEQVEKLYRKVQYNNKRSEALGIEVKDDTSYHFVFSGNPGTGKTTVARLFGELFYQMGILKKGHLVETNRSELVGQYIGQTAKDTKAKVDEAMNGVLFIDEAYSLRGNDASDFGKEAIDTLVKEIEDNRTNLIVILAGYRNEMEDLMKSNPGLQSRFSKFIEFQDYTEEELLEIAIMIAKDQHYEISDDGKKAFVQTIRRLMIDDKFGNARAVRNVMNEAFEEKANNFELDSNEGYTVISANEFSLVEGCDEYNLKQYLDELHSFIGLEGVKNDIAHLIERMEYEKEEEERTGRKNAAMDMHMVFTGNPGTGKTTIARLYGDLLRVIGVLKKGHFKEVSRANLVGKYQGHTAQKVKEACEDAYGGILFIDEAYSLCTGENDTFGNEAVDTLIKEMEDNKDKFLVILAGYTEEMKEFLSTNSGFASRISKTVLFPDYDALELYEIFMLYMKKEHFVMESGCEPFLNEILRNMINEGMDNFGNARDVRKLFNDIKRNMISRVQRDDIEGDDRRKIMVEDLQNVRMYE